MTYTTVDAEQVGFLLSSARRAEVNGRHVSETDGTLWGTNEYGVDTFMAHVEPNGSHLQRAAEWLSSAADPYYGDIDKGSRT